MIEARERGLADMLTAEFGDTPPDLIEALIYCDMTTSPDGEYLPVEERLAEILARYGDGHLVARAITESSPILITAVHRVQDQMLAVS